MPEFTSIMSEEDLVGSVGDNGQAENPSVSADPTALVAAIAVSPDACKCPRHSTGRAPGHPSGMLA